MKTIRILAFLAIASPLLAAGFKAGDRLPYTFEQIRAACVMKGFTNCPIAVSKDKVLLANPSGIVLTDNDIPSVAESKRILASIKPVIFNTTTNQ